MWQKEWVDKRKATEPFVTKRDGPTTKMDSLSHWNTGKSTQLERKGAPTRTGNGGIIERLPPCRRHHETAL
jgi:hypothetical protein